MRNLDTVKIGPAVPVPVGEYIKQRHYVQIEGIPIGPSFSDPASTEEVIAWLRDGGYEGMKKYFSSPAALAVDVPPIYHTSSGLRVPYLKEPGVVLISSPAVNLEGMSNFLLGFEMGFEEYLNDPVLLTPGAQLCKTAGQLCYVSFGPDRTWNADVGKYFHNIKESGHGSVLEHANYSFLLYGVSRSVTHELVRHRAGCAYSQVSQRYVNGDILRYVERPEFAEDPFLHKEFERRIEASTSKYEAIADVLLENQKRAGIEGSKRDLRKRVNQAARAILANEVEAPIIITANARAWRHILEMRCSPHAEIEIRRLTHRIWKCLNAIEPVLFGDYTEVTLPDKTVALETSSRKV